MVQLRRRGLKVDPNQVEEKGSGDFMNYRFWIINNKLTLDSENNWNNGLGSSSDTFFLFALCKLTPLLCTWH